MSIYLDAFHFGVHDKEAVREGQLAEGFWGYDWYEW